MSTQSPLPAQPPSPPNGTQTAVDKRSNAVGTAALVLGIIAAVMAIIPFLGIVAFLLGPAAIVLGIIGLLLKSRKRGAAIAGLVLGVAAVIIASIITSSIAADTNSATNSPAPTIPPAATSSALATDNPGATISERGNIIRALGQGAGLSDKSGNQAVSFVVNKITIDPVCTAEFARPPQNGHFLALDISAQTFPPLKDLFGSGQFDFGASNWKLIAANGTTYNGSLNSGPAIGCLADAEQLPDLVGTGEKVTGTLILDVPATKGTLVFAPTFADASWEWQYPAK
jgi:hypothetical protein